MMIHKYDGYGPDGLRRLYKGGGGGSAKYDNLEELYKEQTESARLLREQAEANLPGAVNSYVDETKQVLDPGYAETQAARAATDMGTANAQERAATTRNLMSMGVNPNDSRFAGSLRTTELNNAHGSPLARTPPGSRPTTISSTSRRMRWAPSPANRTRPPRRWVTPHRAWVACITRRRTSKPIPQR